MERRVPHRTAADPGAGAGEAPAPHVLTRVWRRLDEVCLEHFSLRSEGGLLLWSGQITAVLEDVPHSVVYSAICDEGWSTREARAHCTTGGERAGTVLVRNPDGVWTIDGVERADLADAVDLDIQWSPSTNALPINRLKLEVGESREVVTAWVRLPGLTVERLSQRYTRLGERTYRYESGGGRFTAELEVDDRGFVVRYGELWECVGRG